MANGYPCSNPFTAYAAFTDANRSAGAGAARAPTEAAASPAPQRHRLLRVLPRRRLRAAGTAAPRADPEKNGDELNRKHRRRSILLYTRVHPAPWPLHPHSVPCSYSEKGALCLEADCEPQPAGQDAVRKLQLQRDGTTAAPFFPRRTVWGKLQDGS